MTLNRVIGILAIGLSMLSLRAQCVQKGVVVAFDGTEREPLSGVTIVVPGAATVVSDKDGMFQLKFNTKKPGSPAHVTSIAKTGYDVFNSNSLSNWLLSDQQTFTIVMSPSNKMKTIRDKYMCDLSQNYKQQHEQYWDSIAYHHQRQLAALQSMRDTIDQCYKTYAEDLLDITQYACRLDNLVDLEGEVNRLRQVREQKLMVVDTTRERLLEILKPWTESRDPDQWLRADSIYQALNKRYGNDVHLCQQYADHLINIATRGEIQDTIRLAQSLVPLVNILRQKEVLPLDEARARLTLVITLFRLGKIRPGEDQFHKVWPLLDPLFRADTAFYHEALVRIGLQPGHADANHPLMPLRVLFSARFIDWGCWDTGLDLLNEAYRETEDIRLRTSIEEQMEIWGLIPDEKMIVDEK